VVAFSYITQTHFSFRKKTNQPVKWLLF
jgi:hypothetical protein